MMSHLSRCIDHNQFCAVLIFHDERRKEERREKSSDPGKRRAGQRLEVGRCLCLFTTALSDNNGNAVLSRPVSCTQIEYFKCNSHTMMLTWEQMCLHQGRPAPGVQWGAGRASSSGGCGTCDTGHTAPDSLSAPCQQTACHITKSRTFIHRSTSRECQACFFTL